MPKSRYPMVLNIWQTIILVSILQGCLYFSALFLFPNLRTKANAFLALLILCLVGNLGQYWLRDVGLISDQTLQLIFLPWQICAAPLFLLYVRALQVFNLRPTAHYLLWAPIALVIAGHIFIKIYLLVTGLNEFGFPQWIFTFNIAEEYISMTYCIVVLLVAFRNIYREKKLTNYKGFGVNQEVVKWIRLIAYMGLILCAIWLGSLFMFDQGGIPNYYFLWIFSAIVLNVLGLNGIYNSLKEGPYTLSNIPLQAAFGSSLAENEVHQDGYSSLSVAAPLKYFDQKLIDALITLSTSLSKSTDIESLQSTFRNWVLREFEIVSFDFTGLESSNELRGIAQMSENQRELTVPIRSDRGQLGSFTLHASEGHSFHQQHLYYLKMAAKAYSFHLKRYKRRPDVFTDNNPHFQSLSALMNEKQLYLDPELGLSQLSSFLSISEGYLSKMINKVTELGFNEYVNTYRVEHVKQLMGNEAYDHYSIEGYGYEAGFNSKSTFYKAFTKIEGCSPGVYKKELSE